MRHGYQARSSIVWVPKMPLTLVKDLKGVDDMSFTFELGTPFLPFQQLMGVLPAASKELLPLAYRVGCLGRIDLVIPIHLFNRI
jgi:Xrn1 helical domain